MLENYSEKGDSQLRTVSRRVALHVWLKMNCVTMKLETAREEPLFTPAHGGESPATCCDGPEKTGLNSFGVQNGRSPGFYGPVYKTELLSFVVYFVSQRYVHYPMTGDIKRLEQLRKEEVEITLLSSSLDTGAPNTKSEAEWDLMVYNSAPNRSLRTTTWRMRCNLHTVWARRYAEMMQRMKTKK